MWMTVLLGIGLMAIVFVLLALNIIFKKNGKFPNSHIGNNSALNARGITCATSTDRIERQIKVKHLHLS